MSARLTSYRHDGLTFDVTDSGPADGEPTVLLHGFPERATCWRLVAPHLHEAGLRTFAPDLRGYSRGARPTRRRDYALATLASDVIALIEVIGKPVHLVGHDWGAAVWWAVAATRPDLVRTWTAVSVPHPRAFAKSWVTSGQLLKSWYMFAFNVPRVPELVAARTQRFDDGLRRIGMTEDDVRRFRREVVADGALPGGLGYYRAMFLLDRSMPAVTVPTTLVWSDEDGALGRRCVELCADYVTGPYSFVELRGVSHWIPTHAPDPLAEAILDRVRSVPA